MTDFDLKTLVLGPEPFEGRIAVVVAHPDDEVLGCGVLMSRLHDLRIIHVTDGAPRDGMHARELGFAGANDYMRARQAELEAAMALAGVPATRLIGLAIPDQEASAQLVEIARRLHPLVEDCAAVLTHAYEGGHPDHDATAFAVRAAVGACARSPHGRAPALVEMPFYRAAPDDTIRQVFADAPAAGPEIVLTLSPAERALKQRMVEAHASQRRVLQNFRIEAERFRLAPPYDFGRLPNQGLLLYEGFGWGMTGADWLAHVAAAQAVLRDPAGG